MAIEITSLGLLPKEKPYKGTCSYCNTQIKCLKGDAEYIADGPCGQYGYYAVVCPLCKKYMPVKESNV